MADVTYFKMEIEGVTRQRAEAVGMNYEAILRGCGLTSTVWDTAKRLYKNHCKREGYDSSADIGAMKTDNYTKLCVGFMLNADTYKVDEPPKAFTPVTNVAPNPVITPANPYHDDSDLRLAVDNLSAKIDTTNKILGDIRSALANPIPTRNTEAVAVLDKILGQTKEVNNNTSHLPDIKKEIGFNRKATASIDQKLSGINQCVASARVDLSKVKAFLERFVTGK